MSFFPSGHVCGVWELWPRCRGPSFGMCSVWPVLPSILCRHKGKLIIEYTVHILEYIREIPSCHVHHYSTPTNVSLFFSDHQGGAE